MNNLFGIRYVCCLLLLIASMTSYGQPGSFTNTGQDVFRWDANSDGSGSSFGILADMSGNNQNSIADNLSESFTAAGSKLVYYNPSTMTANGLDAASNINLPNFTFEGMFKPLSTISDPLAANYILERISTNTNEGTLALSVNRGRIKLMYDNGAGPLDFSPACSFTIPAAAVNTDYMHVAFTKSTVGSTTTLQLYYNGTLVSTTTTTTVTCTFDYDLAESSNATSYLGDVDNIRFWNMVRTAAQIKNYCFSEVTGDSGGALLQSFTFSNVGQPQLSSSVPASPYPVIYIGTTVSPNLDGYRIAGTAPNMYMESVSRGQAGFTYPCTGDNPLTPSAAYQNRYIYTVIETPADPGNTLMALPQVLYKEGDMQKGYVLFINNGTLTFAYYAAGAGVRYVTYVNGGGYPIGLSPSTRYIIEARVTGNNSSGTKIALFVNGQFSGESAAFSGMLTFAYPGSEAGFGAAGKGMVLYDGNGTVPFGIGTALAAPFKGRIFEFLVRNSENPTQQTVTTNYYSTLYNTALSTVYNPLNVVDIFDERTSYKYQPAGLGYQSAADNQLTTTSFFSATPPADQGYTFWAHSGGSETVYDIGYNSNSQNAPLNVKLQQREWQVQGVSGNLFYNCIANISLPASKYQPLIPAGQQLVAVLDTDRDGNYRTGSYVVVLKLNAAQTAYTAENIPFDNINAPNVKYYRVRIGYLNQYEFTSTNGSNQISIGQTNNYSKLSASSAANLLTIDNASAMGINDFVLLQDNNAAVAFNSTLVMNDNAGAASNVKVTDRIWRFNVYATPGTIDIAFSKAQLPALPSGTDQYVIVLDQDGVFDAASSKVVLLTDIASYRKAFMQAITDGMYMKLGAVKQNLLQSKSSPNETVLSSIATNASLSLNTADQYSFNLAPACLQDMSKVNLKVTFNTGDMHTSGDVAFATSATVTVTGYADFAMSGAALFTYSNVILNLDESSPEKIWSADITGYYPALKKVKVLITAYTASGQAIINGNLRLKLSLDEKVRVQVLPASTSVIRDLNVARASVDAAAETIFSWSSDQCPTNYFQFQLLRLYNEKDAYATSPGFEYRADILETSIQTVIDWSKALTIETDQQSIQMLLTEGTGFYVWRVRAIGNYYSGGVADSRNWSNWSTDNYPLVSPCALVKSNLTANAGGVLTTTGNTVLWYDQFDRDKNFSYNRSFTEHGNIHESITYATGLLQSKQSITRLNGNGTKASGTDQELIVSQNMYDYAGRAALSTLPTPVANDNDISFQEQFLKNSGNFLYTAEDFDSDATYKAPAPITNGAMSTYYSNANPDPTIPSADGYGFIRQLFNNDGTNDVIEMSGVGPVHAITSNLTSSHTIKITDGGVTDEELVSVFGDEAPAANTVFKRVTTDQNNITSITYTDKEGKVIATCLGKHKVKCTNGPDVAYFTDELIDADDPLNVIPTNIIVNNNLPFGNNGLQAAKTLVLTEPVSIVLDYKITPSLIQNVCGSYCAKCGYVLDVKVINVETNTVVYENNQVINMVTQTDNSCSASQLIPINALTIPLCPGKYTITRQIVPNMAEAAKFAGDIIQAEDTKLDQITSAFAAALNVPDITYDAAVLAYRTFITTAYTDARYDVELYDSDGLLKITTVGASSGSYMSGQLDVSYRLVIKTSCCSIDIIVELPAKNPCDDPAIVAGGYVVSSTDIITATGTNKLATAMMDVLAAQKNITTGVGFDYNNFKLIPDQSATLQPTEWNGTDLKYMLTNMTSGGAYTMTQAQCKQLWNCWNAASLSIAGGPGAGTIPAGNSSTDLQNQYNAAKPADGTTASSAGLIVPATNIVESVLDCYGRTYIGFSTDATYTTYKRNAFRVFYRDAATLTGMANNCDKMFCAGSDLSVPITTANQQQVLCTPLSGCTIGYYTFSTNIQQVSVTNAAAVPPLAAKNINTHTENSALKACLLASASNPTMDLTTPKLVADAQVTVATLVKQCQDQCQARDGEFRAAMLEIYDPNGTGTYKYYNTGPELAVNGTFDLNLNSWYHMNGTAFTASNASVNGKYKSSGDLNYAAGIKTGQILQAGKKYRLTFELKNNLAYPTGTKILVKNGSTILYTMTDIANYTESIVFSTTAISGISFETEQVYTGCNPCVPAQLPVDFTLDNVTIREVLLEDPLTQEDVCCMAQSLTDYCKQQCQLDVVTLDCNSDGVADKMVRIGTDAQVAKWSAIMYGGFQLAETSTVGGTPDQCGTGWDNIVPDVNLTTPASCLNGVPTQKWDVAFEPGWGWATNVGNDGYLYNLTAYTFQKINPITKSFQTLPNHPVNNALDVEDFIIPKNTTNEFLFVDKYPKRLAALYYVKMDPGFTTYTTQWAFQNTNTTDEVYCGVFESNNGFVAGYSTPAGTTSVNGILHKSQASFGSNDYWVYKLDKSGNILWEHSFGGSNNDDLRKIQLLGNYIYLVGRSYSGIYTGTGAGRKTIDEFPTTDRNTTPIWWIIKLDLNGNKVDEYEVTVPISAGAIANGDFDVLFTAEDEFIFSYGDDVTIKKFKRNQERFTRTFLAGSDQENPLHLYKSKQTGYYILGETKSTVFDKPTPSGMGFGLRDILLVKIDNDFNYEWHYVTGGSDDDQTAVENFNNVYLNEINGEIYLSCASKSTPSNKRTAPYLSAAITQFSFDSWIVKVIPGSNTSCAPKHLCIKWLPLITTTDQPQTPQPPLLPDPTTRTPTQEVVVNLNMQRAQCGAVRYDALVQEYLTACMNGTINDLLTVNYNQSYRHYTLYYYDRAGNLTRTVPPKGVKYLSGAAMTRLNHPPHTLDTKYEYNSIGQLVSQNTPDGSLTTFIYNTVGQLRFSQNARQVISNTCSYTKYDELGRIIEVGECSLATAGVSYAALAPYADAYLGFTAYGSTSFPVTGNSQQMISVYTDAATQAAYLDQGQTHLRNRVSYAYSYALNGERAVSYFSYDPHGNVKWVMQELPGQSRNTIGYEYDLISNKVLCAKYNEGQADAFFHKYDYDADNRITAVYTSRDRIVWDKDAAYKYYKHGMLKRTELGEDAVQGMDNTYTIQGWLKAVNSPTLAVTGTSDDGGTASTFAADEYGMTLNYFNGDFTRTASALYSPQTGTAGASAFVADANRQLFNGNISSWVSRVQEEYRDYLAAGNTANTVNSDKFTTANYYTYDDLNRITSSAFSEFSSTGASSANGDKYSRLGAAGKFSTAYTYDGNGNINTLKRNSVSAAGAAMAMDNMTYTYQGATAGAGAAGTNNQLVAIQDAVPAGDFSDDIDTYGNPRYVYDAIGNLIQDNVEGIKIEWTVYGKIAAVKRIAYNTNAKPEVRYTYDAMGQRIKKEVNMQPYTAGGAAQRLPDQIITTFYVHDASGNTMSIYKRQNTAVSGQAGYYNASYDQIEVPIYGSARLGIYVPDAADKTIALKKFQASDLDNMLYEPKTASLRTNFDNYWNVATREGQSINNTSAQPVSLTATSLWNLTTTGDAAAGTYSIVSNTKATGLTFSGKVGNAVAHGLNANGVVQFKAFTALDYFGAANKLVIVSASSNVMMKGSEQLNADPNAQIAITQVPGSSSKYYLITKNGSNIVSYVIDMSLPGYGTAGAPQGEIFSSATVGTADMYGRSFLVRENKATGTSLLYASRYTTPVLPADECGHIELLVYTLPSDPYLIGGMTAEVMCRPIGLLSEPNVYTTFTQGEEQGELAFNAKGDELLYYSQKKRTGWFSHQESEVLIYTLGYDGKIAKNAVAAKYTIPVTDASLPGSSAAISADGRFVYYSKDQLYKTNGSAAHIWRYDLRNGSNVEVSGENIAGDVRNLYSGLLVEVADNKSQTAISDKETDQGITQAGTNNVVFSVLTGQIGNWPLQNFRIYAAATGTTISVRRINKKRYELSDHLGNVTVVVSDRKKGTVAGSLITTTAKVISYTNYYAFGMAIKPRSNAGSEEYRYGYNGQEKDNDVGGNIYSAEFWEYDAKTARRWNVDPIVYSHQSSYACFDNNPIYFNDPRGLEANGGRPGSEASKNAKKTHKHAGFRGYKRKSGGKHSNPNVTFTKGNYGTGYVDVTGGGLTNTRETIQHRGQSEIPPKAYLTTKLNFYIGENVHSESIPENQITNYLWIFNLTTGTYTVQKYDPYGNDKIDQKDNYIYGFLDVTQKYASENYDNMDLNIIKSIDGVTQSKTGSGKSLFVDYVVSNNEPYPFAFDFHIGLLYNKPKTIPTDAKIIKNLNNGYRIIMEAGSSQYRSRIIHMYTPTYPDEPSYSRQTRRMIQDPNNEGDKFVEINIYLLKK